MARAASRQHGVVSTAQLHGAGLTDDMVAARAAAGRLHRLHRGVYAVGHRHLTYAGRCQAAVLAVGEDAVASHSSAAILWGLLQDFGGKIEVTVPRHVHHRPGIRVHCTCRLGEAELTKVENVPVTTVGRTLLDIAETATERAFRRAVREAHARRLTSEEAIRDQLARSNGHQGVRLLSTLVIAGWAPTRSELEDRVLALLVSARDLPRPIVNPRLPGLPRRVEPDFLFPHHRVIVEADGAAAHANHVARDADARRQAMLEAAGYCVVRVTWDQVVRHPAETLRRVRQALARAEAGVPMKARF